MEEDQPQGVPIQSLIEAGVVGLAQGKLLCAIYFAPKSVTTRFARSVIENKLQ